MEPNGTPDFLVTLVSASFTGRYIWIAGYTWILYDWLITLNQEIDLIWRRRSGAWQSRLLYAFIRYHGLGLSTFNIVAVVQSNWSARFCRVYFYITSMFGLAQVCAVQGALVWRLYVMYNRSLRVLISTMVLLAIQFMSMATLYGVDTRHFTITPAPAPITGCTVMGPSLVGAKIYWCISLAFETYLCALVLPAAFSQRKSAGTGGVALLNILIRDSLVWYFCLLLCLLLNSLSFITGNIILIMVGLPATQAAATVGGPRLMMNLRAAYFSSSRDRPSTFGGFSSNTDYMETKGTVGRFRPALEHELVDGEDEDGATSFGAGVWADLEDSGSRVHDHDRPARSPSSSIVLQRLDPEGRSRASSAPGSSSVGVCELGDSSGVLRVSASGLSEPAALNQGGLRPQSSSI